MRLEYVGTLKNTTYDFEAHVHPHMWEIIYYFEGQGTLTVGDRDITFSKGDLVFQPPAVAHSEHSKEGFRNIHMGVLLTGFPYTDALCVSDTLDKDLYHIMMMCYNNYYRGVAGDHSVMRALVELLIEYTMMLGGMPDYNEYVQQMERIMIKHFANQDFSLQDMYKSLYISEDYARTLFKREMKCTPVQFLTRLRLRSACDQFRRHSKHISIQEVAMRVGFQDAYYFSRQFKAYMGMSPRQWICTYCDSPDNNHLVEIPVE